MAVLKSELILSLIDRISQPARAISQRVEHLERQIESNNRAVSAAQGTLLRAGAAATGFAFAVAQPVRAASDFESAMADVRKVVDFPTPDGLQQMSDDLLDLSKRLPIAATGLAEIAASAGAAGIAADDIIPFTEAAAKIGVAFDISAGEAGDAVAKLMTALGLGLDEAVSLTDAMNHLSNSQASTAAQVLDVVRRVGAQGTQFGFTAEQTAAFGSAMVAAGSEADVAATSFRNMGLALVAGESATARQVGALEKLGLKSTDVAERMQEDAVGTTLDVLDRLGELPAEMRASVSMDLFGREARALGPLLTNTDLLRESLGLVADETEYAGSAFREYAVRSETFANAAQLFRNQLDALSIVIGSALIPPITELMDRLAPVVESIADWADANPQLIATLTEVTAALLGFRLVMAALSLVGLLGKGGVLWIIAKALGAIAAIASWPLVALAAGIAAIAFAAANWEQIGPWVRAAADAIGDFVDDIPAALAPLADEMRRIGEEAIDALLDGFKRRWEVTLEWLRGRPAAVAGALADLPSALNTGEAPDTAATRISRGQGEAIRGRASGGPISANVPYIVGERGPELRVFDAPGHIVDARDTARLTRAMPAPRMAATGAPGASAGARNVTVTVGDIILPSNTNGSPEELARAFGSEVAALLRSQFSDPY